MATPAPANALIKRDNPEMTDALLAYGVAKMKEYGIIDSGDAKTSGIGAMSEARWRDFFDTAWRKPGSIPPTWISARPTRCNSSTRRSGCNPVRDEVGYITHFVVTPAKAGGSRANARRLSSIPACAGMTA